MSTDCKTSHRNFRGLFFFFFFAFNLIKYHISYPDCLQQLLGVTGMGNDMRVQ